MCKCRKRGQNSTPVVAAPQPDAASLDEQARQMAEQAREQVTAGAR